LKRTQRTILLALALVALGGGGLAYVLRYEQKTLEQRQREDMVENRLFVFGRANVVHGTIWAKGATLSFSRDPNFGWMLTDPVQGPADLVAIQSAIDRMVGLRIGVFASEDADDAIRRANGIRNPPWRGLRVETTDGSAFFLRVGEFNPAYNAYAVSDAEGRRIGLAEPTFFWSLDRPLDDYREKRLFPFPEETVNSVAIQYAGERTLQITRTAEGWEVSSPEVGAIDAEQVTKLIQTMVKQLRTERFEPKAATELSGKADYTVWVGTHNGISRRAEFRCRDRKICLAEIDGSVMATPEWLTDFLDNAPKDLLDRTVVTFSQDSIATVAVHHRGHDPFQVVREGDDWYLEPGHRLADRQKVDALLLHFARLKGTKIIEHSGRLKRLGLEPPIRELTFAAANGGPLHRIRIGDFADPDHVFATGEDPRKVHLLAAGILRIVPTGADELAESIR
jgi:hypothetical protein